MPVGKLEYGDLGDGARDAGSGMRGVPQGKPEEKKKPIKRQFMVFYTNGNWKCKKKIPVAETASWDWGFCWITNTNRQYRMQGPQTINHHYKSSLDNYHKSQSLRLAVFQGVNWVELSGHTVHAWSYMVKNIK